MPVDTEQVIVREVRIEASPETVFAFLTDARRIAAWMGRKAQADARPGGALRIDYNGFDVMKGEYVALEPHTRVVFTWGWESQVDGPTPAGSSTVEFTLVRDGAATLLTMVHSGLEQQAFGAHSTGWDHFLPRLAARAEGRDPGPDAWMDAPNDLLAVELRDLIAQAREVIAAIPAERWGATAPGDSRTRAVVADHIVAHLGLADLALATARGEQSPLASLTAAGIDAVNARHAAERAAVAKAEVLAALDARGPVAVAAVRSIGTEGLLASQPMAFAGGVSLTAEQIVRGALIGNIREHLDSLR